MIRSELPIGWIPSRTPHPLTSFAITVASLAVAFGARFLVLGVGRGEVQTSTVFPAFIIIAIYAGWRWSLGAVTLVGILLGWATAARGHGGLDAVAWISLGLYIASALITVLVAGAARELVIRLNEASEARRIAEANRRESESRFGALADSAPTLMWVTNPDRTRAFVNRAYVEYLGETPEQALVTDWRSRLHPDDLDRILIEQRQGEASNQPFTLEARYRRADGEWRWLRSISRPRPDARGEFDGYIGIAFDITDAKKAEADLKSINELLAERVQAALAERDEAQAALMQSQKLEAVGQLTGGVAHDFNNLLTVVIGALDIIERHPSDDKRRSRMVEAALTAARRGERLTQQLLAFSRRQPLRAEKIVIDDLLRDSEPLLRRAMGENYNFHMDLQAPGAQALVDGGQLEAAVLNLLINARDAVETGGHISLATRLDRLTARTGECSPGDYFLISVTDDGSGMSADTISHAFEPFFTTKTVGKGTGLGLSQVYGFARQSGGDVEIDSQPGRGASVRIRLPAAQADPATPAPQIDRPRNGPGVLKVLLVEDHPDVAELVEAMLHELGHTVISAPDAHVALKLAHDHPDLSLVLTDVIMPGGLSGVDLARKITSLRPGLPIILSSGYTGEALAGADDAPWPLLRKPYTLDALAEVIASTVPERQKYDRALSFFDRRVYIAVALMLNISISGNRAAPQGSAFFWDTEMLTLSIEEDEMADGFGALEFTQEVRDATDALWNRVSNHVTPLEWQLQAPLIAAINSLKAQKNAVILAHNYMTPEIFHGVGDFVGDSLGLAKEAAKSDAKIIVQAGVHFMAETSKILAPEKTVLIPDPLAGCSLASSLTGADVRMIKARYPGVPVVTYVNTTAEVKAETDICCTSANAVQVVEWAAKQWGTDRVILIPDEFLARNVARQTAVKIIAWAGRCEVHERFNASDIADLRASYPNAEILAHPECPAEVIEASDFAGSTAAMSDYVTQRRPKQVVLITECSMADNVAVDAPDTEFVRPCNLCPHMKRISLENIYQALLHDQFEVTVDPAIAERARAAVQRMVDLPPPAVPARYDMVKARHHVDVELI